METPITAPLKKFKVTHSGRKLLAIVFSGRDFKCVLLVDVLDCGDVKYRVLTLVHLRDYGRSFVGKGLCCCAKASFLCMVTPRPIL
jgi:hypothetical protein